MNLGIGSGWFELEHKSFGLDFKTVRGRLEALEEALRIIKGVLAGEKVTLEGKHYRVKDAFCHPAPLQKGGLPIMIGGEGKKILLRIVAQYADMWNAFGSPAHMRELIDVIRAHGDRVTARHRRDREDGDAAALLHAGQRSPGHDRLSCSRRPSVRRPSTMRGRMIVGGKQEMPRPDSAYADVGVTHFIFMCIAPYPHDQIQGFAEEVAPLARAPEMPLERIVIVGASLAGLRAAETLRAEGYAGAHHADRRRAPSSLRPPAADEGDPSRRVDGGAALASSRRLRRSRARAAGSGLSPSRSGPGLKPSISPTAAPCSTTVSSSRPARRRDASPAVREIDGVFALRTLEDALALRAALERKPRVVVVGAGFIGAEVAASCRQLGLVGHGGRATRGAARSRARASHG